MCGCDFCLKQFETLSAETKEGWEYRAQPISYPQPDKLHNLTLAFDIAEKYLGVEKYVDPAGFCCYFSWRSTEERCRPCQIKWSLHDCLP